MDGGFWHLRWIVLGDFGIYVARVMAPSDPVDGMFMRNAFFTGKDPRTPFQDVPEAMATKQNMILDAQQAQREEEDRARAEEERQKKSSNVDFAAAEAMLAQSVAQIRQKKSRG